MQSPLLPQMPASAGEIVYWDTLYGSSRSLAVINAVKTTNNPVVLITTDVKSMESVLEEINFYLKDDTQFPVLQFPDLEVLPYDNFSPYQDIVSERIKTLFRLLHLNQGLVIVPASTVMMRLMPVQHLAAQSLLFRRNESLDIEAFRNNLFEYGYRAASQVIEHGEFAFRGSILDIFPMGSDVPYRIDLLDETIDSIRVFDPESQKSYSKIDEINILPANELNFTEQGINTFRRQWREYFNTSPLKSDIYTDVSNRIVPQGIEFYLPFFYETTSTLFDFFNREPTIVFDPDSMNAVNTHWQTVNARYEQVSDEKQRMVIKPEDLYITPEKLLEKTSGFPQVRIRSLSSDSDINVIKYSTRMPMQLAVDPRLPEPLGIFKKYIREFNGRVLLVAESPGRRESILELLKSNGLSPKLIQSWKDFEQGEIDFGLTVSPLEIGAILENPRLAIISESQLFGERVYQRRLRKRKQSNADTLIRNLAELAIGSPVVHEENGVGRYRGLVELTIDEITNEYIHLEYDRGDKLYVPVSSLNLVSRYTGSDPEHAPLHRLGSGQWEKIRSKAEKRIYDVAAELLDLHAKRASRKGIQFVINQDEYNAFIQGFPFEETPDQEDSINAVVEDMKSHKAMDRLICGDAGFGKTEVAMRATFVCVSNHKQVALLVPTTLLAQQHFQNFKDRFADWPVNIEVLSRFVSKQDQSEIIERIVNGKVDIVIGTHRLLQSDIKFKELGLLIIDEEHRFGVRQKEKIKALRSEVEILTLTATPIPRTLNMAISELRDLSIIATPPSRRHAVKTFMHEWKTELLVEAMQREIKRGGQVYFLHNDVETIEKMAERIQALLPDARVNYAHGQMPEKQLEQIMQNFYHRRFNVLICTTIIESGIDVPTANTIIINRADKLGLAQLYQLRGRVGRSHHHAFAYMIVPSPKEITKDALKRLQAVESMEDLGVGFTLAIHDLEIRGAGEILGDEQSGQIQEIGYSLYVELLERAVNALKSGKQPQTNRPLDHGVEIDIHTATLIPSSYLPDVHTRLIMYKKIAAAKTQMELDLVREEMVDRFGDLPESTRTLFKITALKLQLSHLGISKIDLGKNGGRITFGKYMNIDTANIINLITEYPETYKLDGAEKLRIIKEFDDAESRMTFLVELFDKLQVRDAA